MTEDYDTLDIELAEQFANAITQYKESFIVGFLDFVHGSTVNPVLPSPEENWMKIVAYNLGYTLGKAHMESTLEDK